MRIRQHYSLPVVPLMILCFFSLMAACSGSGSGGGVNDTIYLESGVKYIYLKKGEGTEIDSGSQVNTHINLIINEDTVWSTYAPDQQQLGFTAKVTSLIKGFDEVVMLTRQGDRILAVIPPELGYGEAGAGGGLIPPNATLHFDIDVLEVSAPSGDPTPKN